MYLSKKGNLITGFIAIIFALAMFAGAFCLISLNQPATPTDATFTFIKTEVKPLSKTRRYELYVSEENSPLFISTLANGYIDSEALQDIKFGDRIICKIIDGNDSYCYQIVELVANNKVILSLENAQKAEKNNSIVGAVVTSIIGALMLVMSAIAFYRAKYGLTQAQQNANKTLLKDFMYKQAVDQNKSEQEIQQMMDMIDSIDMSDKLPCSEEELREIFANSFYVKNNRDYTTALEHLQNNNCNRLFKMVLKEKLNDGEMRVFYDAGTINDSAIFLSYKINNKVLCLYLLNDDETRRFTVDKADLALDMPVSVKLTKKERTTLVEQLREYNRLREDIFEIGNDLLQ